MTRRKATATVSPVVARRPRSYSEIVRLLVNEAARKIEDWPRPDYVVGTPTKAIRRLVARQKRATWIAARCDAQLAKLGVHAHNGEITLHHTRRTKLERAWQAHKTQASARIREMKAAALVDLIDRPPAEAKAYLQRLRMLLNAAVQGAAK